MPRKPVERIKVYDSSSQRWILESSSTFKKRKAGGMDYSRAPRKRVPVFVPPKDLSVTKTFQDYPVDKSDVSWKQKQPSSVGQRRELVEKCGKSCMLLPDQLKFPVCNKDPPPCVYNRKGINAAYVRARQWKYEDVATSILHLRKKLQLETKKTKSK